MTVSEPILAYLRFADGYYRKDGEPAGEYDSIRHSLKPLRRLYGQVGASDFGPLALKRVREELTEPDLCRNEINKRVGRIVRMFEWGVENEHVEPMIRCWSDNSLLECGVAVNRPSHACAGGLHCH